MSGITWEESKLNKYSAPDKLASKIDKKPLKVYPKLIWLLDILASEKKIKATFKQGLEEENKQRFLNALKTAGIFSAKNLVSLKGELLLNCLEEACKNQNESFTIELIKRGMPVKESAWTLAQKLDQSDVLTAMVEHAATNRSFEKLYALYNWSCERRYIALSKALLHHFLNVQDVDKLNVDKLNRAAIQGNLAEVTEIVASLPANRKMESLNRQWPLTGQTPLQLAHAAGHSEIFECLIKAQANRKLKVISPEEKILEFDVNTSFFSARSAFFNALFEARWGNKEEFEMQEDDLEAFSQMVTFLYSGYLNLDPGNFKRIIAIADRYTITGIKEKCLKWLSNHPIFIDEKEKLSVLDKIPSLSLELPPNPAEIEPKSEEDYFKKWLTSEEINEKEDVHRACEKGWLEALQYMQRRGIKIDYSLQLVGCSHEKIILFLIQSLIQSGPVTKSAFCNAAYAGSFEGVKLLLEHIPPNEKVTWTTEALGALSLGSRPTASKEVAKLLLNEGALVNVNGDHSPLDNAAKRGWTEVVHLMLQRIPQNEKVAKLNRVKFEGEFYESTLLLEVCQNADVGWEELAELLIQEGADVSFVSRGGETALYHAIFQGNFKLAKLIWEKIPPEMRKAQLNQIVNEKETALTEALRRGDEEFVLFLLNEGVEISLHDAVKAGCLEVTKQILKKIPPAEKQTFLDQKYGENQITALCAAFPDPNDIPALIRFKRYRQLAQFLIEEGASVSIAGADGSTPLFYASRVGFTEIAKQILRKIPPSEKSMYVNQKGGPYQTTAFLESLASPIGMEDLPKLLLEEGADATLAGNNGMNVLHALAITDSIDFVQQLFTRIPAENRASFINQSCQLRGVAMPPLMMAFDVGNRPLALFLIQNGAQMSLPILSRAVIGGFADLIRPIWEAIPLERQKEDIDPAPPLLAALIYNQLACAKKLMEMGVDVAQTTSEGLNALHLAIFDNLEGVVEEILKRVPENKRKEFVNQTVSFKTLSSFFISQRLVDELQRLTIPDEIEFAKLRKLLQKAAMNLSLGARKDSALTRKESQDDAITPLKLAREIGSEAIIRMLKEAGAE